ncbi:magnesium transporter MgtE N-terminal domain-containing protein [Geodermatophilus sp. DSM 44513]|uniref:magnesium transporter MgtE N-terminal domain-containing protein n=1 Tax=Geodermatophilus sp. DSM 44513 TaxID=1528104 RepID=UPI00126C9A8B|nr:CBS domain-containing protein [Geodermatophilus sp. DSM 44513]WNV76616.1 CBS domain-containing protein [Geodermatophilus sp. DSM 44513]
MTTVSRAYVSRLAGLPVLDPDGDRVGKVRDVVVALRVGTAAPRVLGLVVEVVARRRTFVPMGRVTTLDPASVVLSAGTLSLKRFEQRRGETLVLGELLDRRVQLTESGRTAAVVDAGIEQTRTGDWVLSRLAVQEPGRLGRRGQLHQVAWDEVGGLELSPTGQGAETLIATYRELNAADLAHALQDLPVTRRQEVAEALDDERLADVLGELPEADQIAILGTLPESRAADVLEVMDTDDAADLLAELSHVDRDRLLELMEPDEADPVRRLLQYTEDTAGGIMTSEPVVLTPDATIAEALARVREPELTPALASQVYVCRPPSATPTGRYLGLAHTQRLLREPPSTLVSGVLDDLGPLRPEAPLAEVTRYFATYNLVAAPVVDAQGRLVGAVSVDDVLDHLLPEDWRERARRG